MSTLSEMRARIADDLDRSDLSTQIDKAINRAIRHYAYKTFWFTQTTGTFVTVANKKSYGISDGLPSDIKEIDYAKIRINDTDYELTKRTYAYIEQVDPSIYTGDPDDYAWYAEKMHLYPVPDSSYNVTVSYSRSYTEMTSDAATNDFTTEAEELIESRVRWWIYSRVIKDYEAANIAKANENEARLVLEAETERLTTSQRLKPINF